MLRGVVPALALLTVLAACGAPARPAGGDGAASIDADTVLAGRGLLLQRDGEPAGICLGPVAESYPPQCAGVELVGFAGWDSLPHESASGTTWGQAYVVGTFDGERLTLSEQPSTDAPAGWQEPAGPSGRGRSVDPADVDAAQRALFDRAEELQLLDAYAPESGLLHVGVVVADRATVDAVRAAVSPWLAADEVSVTGALRPLG